MVAKHVAGEGTGKSNVCLTNFCLPGCNTPKQNTMFGSVTMQQVNNKTKTIGIQPQNLRSRVSGSNCHHKKNPNKAHQNSKSNYY
jgi:hypothetical protein